MPITPIANSTTYNPAYNFSQFVPPVSSDFNGDSITPYFDIFSPKIINGINAIIIGGNVVYTGGPITTIAYKYYKSATAYWMVCLASGIIQPLEIILGTILNLAVIDNIIASLSLQQNSSARNISSVVI